MEVSHLNVVFLYPQYPCPWDVVTTTGVKGQILFQWIPSLLHWGEHPFWAPDCKLHGPCWPDQPLPKASSQWPEAPCLPAELWRHQRLTLNSEGPLIYSWEKGMAKKKLLFLRFKHNFSPSVTVGGLPTQYFREPGSRPRFALMTITSFPLLEKDYTKNSRCLRSFPHANILSTSSSPVSRWIAARGC